MAMLEYVRWLVRQLVRLHGRLCGTVVRAVAQPYGTVVQSCLRYGVRLYGLTSNAIVCGYIFPVKHLAGSRPIKRSET